MELVFDAAGLIYVVEGLGSVELLDSLHQRNGAVVIPQAIHTEFCVKPLDPTMPQRLVQYVCSDPPFDGEVDPGVPGPLSIQDRTVLQTARVRGATLVTDDIPLAREAKRLGVAVLGVHGLLDHARLFDCVSVDSHGRLKQLASVLMKRL